MPRFYVDRGGKRRYLHQPQFVASPAAERRARRQAADMATPDLWWRTSIGAVTQLLELLKKARPTRWGRPRFGAPDGV
jgi:hypothetical protein